MTDLSKASPESVGARRTAGWHENRQADVSDWVEQLAGPGLFNDVARHVLTGKGKVPKWKSGFFRAQAGDASRSTVRI
jgi:hypothetical protein